LVAEAAERHRAEVAVAWLGKELPAWTEPCRIRVTGAAGGSATSFAFEGGKVLRQEMMLEGPLERILAANLPHEITHTVLAHALGRPVPRWADEGAAMHSEEAMGQRLHAQRGRELINTPGRYIPLARLLTMRDYPADVAALYAEGYALTGYLIERRGRQAFVEFLERGMRDGWDPAITAVYGFKDTLHLEQAWRERLAREVPAAAARPRTDAGRSGPLGLQPLLTLLAAADRDGRVTVRVPVTSYVPTTAWVYRDGRDPEAVRGYVPEVREEVRRYDVREVQAFETNGDPIRPRDLAARLAQETVVVVPADGRKPDPSRLVVLRPGAVILVLQANELHPAPPPAAPPRRPASGREGAPMPGRR
jgi:hypothetical protein